MKLIETKDGSHSILSEKFGVSYHSEFGAVEESKHIFIKAGLDHIAINSAEIDIMEIGFGSGLNAFLSMIKAEKSGLKISYTGIEAYPIPQDLIDQLNYPSIIENGEYSNEFDDIHKANWDVFSKITGNFSLKKEMGFFENIVYEDSFDLVYFDAFDPKAQPELWETPLLSIVYDSMKNYGILVTYCAQGQFKRNLRSVGFLVEGLKGPTGKREMTRCTKIV